MFRLRPADNAKREHAMYVCWAKVLSDDTLLPCTLLASLSFPGFPLNVLGFFV